MIGFADFITNDQVLALAGILIGITTIVQGFEIGSLRREIELLRARISLINRKGQT